jgi:hypothetical protein
MRIALLVTPDAVGDKAGTSDIARDEQYSKDNTLTRSDVTSSSAIMLLRRELVEKQTYDCKRNVHL